MKLLLSFLLPAFACAQALAADRLVSFGPGVDAEGRRLLVESAGGRVLKDFPLTGAVLAEFRGEDKAAALARRPGVEAVEEDEEIFWLAGEALPLSLEAAAGEAAGLLAGEPGPVQPPAVPPAVSTQAPIAPVYISTVNAAGKADKLSWGTARMRAPEVWAVTKGASARVAVLDTGVDCAHPDLAPNCLPGRNILDPRLPPDDDKGHGSHVAGIIAGALNWKGVAGVAPEASIIPVKVLNSSGSGKVSEIIEGIEWSVANKAHIINMSLGAKKFSEAQGKAVKAARAAGVLIIAAAGNDGGAVSYPAAYPEVLAVTALGYDNKLTGFSCRGPETDFTAPGERIFSAAPGGSFLLANGTSQAAPHVTGFAALAVAMGAKGPDAIERALTGAAWRLPLPEDQQGRGAPVGPLLLKHFQPPPAR